MYPSGNGTAGGDFNFAFNVLPGDVNQDGIVNVQDLTLVTSGWLEAGPVGDVNADGLVNGEDLALLSSNWLTTLPAGTAQFGASIAGADSAVQVAGTVQHGQRVPANSGASPVAVNSVVPGSVTSLSVGASLPTSTMVAGLRALNNAELTISPSSVVGPLQPDRVAAFLGRIDALPNSGSIDRVLSQAAGEGSHNLGPSARSGVISFVESRSAAGSYEKTSNAFQRQTVGEPWSSAIDDDLLATLATGRRL